MCSALYFKEAEKVGLYRQTLVNAKVSLLRDKNKYLVTKLKKVTKAVTRMKANIRLIHDRKNEAKGDRNAIALLQVEIRLTGGTKRIFISTKHSLCHHILVQGKIRFYAR